MINAGRSSDCLFCNILRRSPGELPWHDQPLTLEPDVGAVIAGLGAFVPGYVLVFPEQHVESTLLIGGTARQAFSDLLRTTVEQIAAMFGPTTIFEHGSCSSGPLRRSACLDHAHMHIIPGSYDLAKWIEPATDMRQHRTLPRASHPEDGYLFLHEPASEPVYTGDPGVSQFFRRHIASEVGEPGDWDYLLFPRWENVRETVSRFHAQGCTIDMVTLSSRDATP